MVLSTRNKIVLRRQADRRNSVCKCPKGGTKGWSEREEGRTSIVFLHCIILCIVSVLLLYQYYTVIAILAISI